MRALPTHSDFLLARDRREVGGRGSEKFELHLQERNTDVRERPQWGRLLTGSFFASWAESRLSAFRLRVRWGRMSAFRVESSQALASKIRALRLRRGRLNILADLIDCFSLMSHRKRNAEEVVFEAPLRHQRYVVVNQKMTRIAFAAFNRS